MALFIALGSVSCSSDDDEDGITNSLSVKGWEKTDYQECKYNNVSYIEVPAEGGVFTFRYTKGGSISIDTISMDNGIHNHFYPEYKNVNDAIFHGTDKACETFINGNELTIKFYPNNEFTRKSIITTTTGGEKTQFLFWQKPIGQSSDVANKLVGEWVINTEKSELVFSPAYWSEQKRLCISEDGTYKIIIENYTSGRFEKRFSETDAVWKDSCGFIIFCYEDHSGWGKYKLEQVDDNNLKIDAVTSKPIYERLAITNEPVKPCYRLNIVYPDGSSPSSESYAKPGDKFNLECKLYAHGKNYAIDEIYLICNDRLNVVNEEGHFGSTISLKSDTIDISQYAAKDYEFSIPRTCPAANHSIIFTIEIKGHYTTDSYWVREKKPSQIDPNTFTDIVYSAGLYIR